MTATKAHANRIRRLAQLLHSQADSIANLTPFAGGSRESMSMDLRDSRFASRVFNELLIDDHGGKLVSWNLHEIADTVADTADSFNSCDETAKRAISAATEHTV